MIWLPLKDFPNYEISDCGDFYRLEHEDSRGRKLRAQPLYPHMSGRYQRIRIKGKERAVHQLVLETFNSKRPKRTLGLHRDGDRLNNHISNLYWGSSKDNAADRKRHGNEMGHNSVTGHFEAWA